MPAAAVTLRYRPLPVPRKTRCLLPAIDLAWWVPARRLPIPWQPRLELLPDEAAELARSRIGL